MAVNIVQYPTWDDSPGSEGDIALIKLNSPVSSDLISPLCLPWSFRNETFQEKVGVTIGWGVTENGQTSSVLRKVIAIKKDLTDTN